MALRMSEHKRKAIRCFFRQLDQLEDRSLNAQGQDGLIRDVIARNDITEPSGRPMTVAQFKVYMREAWKRKDGRPNGSSKNMFNVLFEGGSRVCGQQLLRAVDFQPGQTESDIFPSDAPLHGASNHVEPPIDLSREKHARPKNPKHAIGTSNALEAAEDGATQHNSQLLINKGKAGEMDVGKEIPQQISNKLNREVLFGRRQAKLSDDTTTEAMNTIWYKMRGIHANMIAGTNMGRSGYTRLDLQADGLLLQIYQRIFGPEWKREALRVFQSEQCRADFFILSCIGAAIWILVLDNEKPLPWKGAKYFMQNLGGIQTYFNSALEDFGLECDMQSIIIRAIHLQDRDEDFQESTIQSKAAELKDETMHALQSQFHLVDAHTLRKGVDFTWEDQNERLQEVFYEALLLKSRIGTSPDEYHCEWVESGVEYVRREMKDAIQEGGDRMVGFCVLPKVLAKYEKKNHWRTQAGAWVFTLPLDP